MGKLMKNTILILLLALGAATTSQPYNEQLEQFNKEQLIDLLNARAHLALCKAAVHQVPCDLEDTQHAHIKPVYKQLKKEADTGTLNQFNIIKTGIVPKTIGHFAGEFKKILICNQYQNKYWSLMLVEQC